ncbi:hypothetical protein D3C79_784220 [compost metagenome]
MLASHLPGVSFQRTTTPTPSTTISSAISGRNKASKYGGPTDSLAPVSASSTSGYRVPSRIIEAATTSTRLLASSSVSRDHRAKPTWLLTTGARRANRVSEPPTTNSRKIRMKMPRDGSAANACTEVSTPERTRKVPSRLSENAAIASSTVQLLNTPRFSVTASEWISAVPTSQGMNEAFSTGSQNHQPPQPSS